MFARHRDRYLDEEEFRALQDSLMASPEGGDLIQGAGGLRKVRFTNKRRGKGKRGGLRVVYFWWESGAQFWLFTLFEKSEVSDLSNDQRETLKRWVKNELEARRQK